MTEVPPFVVRPDEFVGLMLEDIDRIAIAFDRFDLHCDASVISRACRSQRAHTHIRIVYEIGQLSDLTKVVVR